MNEKKTIIIGDVHGLLNELQALLYKCSYNPNLDRCILVGDLVDRGPNSSSVVSFAEENKLEITLGNHDNRYVRFYQHYIKEKNEKNYKNPMKLKGEKLDVWNSLTDKNIIFLQKQPHYIQIPEYNCFVVHAGVYPGKSIYEQSKETYMHARYICKNSYKRLHLGPNFTQPQNSVHWSEVYEGKIDIVYGHDVQSLSTPVIRINSNGGRTISIDTGACFGGNLTAIVYTNKHPRGYFTQVQSKYSYKDYKIAHKPNRKH